MATRLFVAALDHLRPRLQTIGRQPPHREDQRAAGDDVFQPGAPITERPREEEFDDAPPAKPAPSPKPEAKQAQPSFSVGGGLLPK